MLELEHSFNPQNDHISAKEKTSIPPRLVSRHPAKIMVWGDMRAQVLVDLHVVPLKTVCGRRLLCHRDPAEVSASQPCAGRQHLLGSDEENSARDVAANLPSRRCTGALVQESPTLVPREREGLLGQKHMTRELSGPQPN